MIASFCTELCEMTYAVIDWKIYMSTKMFSQQAGPIFNLGEAPFPSISFGGPLTSWAMGWWRRECFSIWCVRSGERKNAVPVCHTSAGRELQLGSAPLSAWLGAMMSTWTHVLGHTTLPLESACKTEVLIQFSLTALTTTEPFFLQPTWSTFLPKS